MSGRNGSDLPGDVPPPTDYPTIRFLLRHGQSLALAAGAAIAISGFAASINGMGMGPARTFARSLRVSSAS